jgi:hypothetical protein
LGWVGKNPRKFLPLLSSSTAATAAKHLLALNDSAAEFYLNSVVAERFFAPLWAPFAISRQRRECRELSDRAWLVFGSTPGTGRARQRASVPPELVSERAGGAEVNSFLQIKRDR